MKPNDHDWFFNEGASLTYCLRCWADINDEVAIHDCPGRIKLMTSGALPKRHVAQVDSKEHGRWYIGPFNYDTIIGLTRDKPIIRVRAWRKPNEGEWCG